MTAIYIMSKKCDCVKTIILIEDRLLELQTEVYDLKKKIYQISEELLKVYKSKSQPKIPSKIKSRFK
jgi:hypothetical protein